MKQKYSKLLKYEGHLNYEEYFLSEASKWKIRQHG